MKLVFGYECFADRDVLRFLRQATGRQVKDFHGFGQGDVLNALLVKRTITLGMVDEDPRSTHHRLRDSMTVVRATKDFELRESQGRYLAILKPELEEAFVNASKLLGVETRLPKEPSSMRRVLLPPGSASHKVFVQALVDLHAEAKARRQTIFLTELIAMIEKVPST